MSSLNRQKNAKVAWGHARPMRAVLMLIFLIGAGLDAFAANVVYICRTSVETPARRQLEDAARFYGLSLESLVVSEGKDGARDLRSLRKTELLAVVVNADALPILREKTLLTALHREHGDIPLMIAGAGEDSSVELLRQWSSGAILGIHSMVSTDGRGWYSVAADRRVAQQLGGAILPLIARSFPSFVPGAADRVQWLMKAHAGSMELPVFAWAEVRGREVFFATEAKSSDIPTSADPYRQQMMFASLAPSMFFLHLAAGEHAWHSDGEYANFTIDDLWLREPYGHVNYEQLLVQAEEHNFHTTIAFIPWNFDRSQPQMVTLFREHPDRLSICVHGNNHVHQEFGPLAEHPLTQQDADMKQGLARMERFSAVTHIPYDPIMVFPHSIAPEASFAELKRNQYLATANSLNVPSDAQAPAGPDFALRTATLRFGNFPSLRRYSVESDIPRTQLAIDAFLGNPMLFYAHESFFAPGIDAFDPTADLVNTLEPQTQWRSLGGIARHLYLERMRDDGQFEVRAFSSVIQIANRRDRVASFLVRKEEDFSLPFTVLVAGQSYPYERSGSMLEIKLTIPPGVTRQVEVHYGVEPAWSHADVSKPSLKTNAIRLLSDFRDNAVSNTRFGRRFIRSYADNGRTWNLAMAGVFALLVCFLATWIGRHFRKGIKTRPRPVAASGTG